jgi:hypothetical protein
MAKTPNKKQREIMKAQAQLNKMINKTWAEPKEIIAEPRYTMAEVRDLIDRDRIAAFIAFVEALPPNFHGQVFGVARQVRSIVRVLRKLGFSDEPL